MDNDNTKRYLAEKRPGYLIEPVLYNRPDSWENHHATNPTAIRLTVDPRVFLGYRAGGRDGYFFINDTKVWRSHLGLAILDERGEKVVTRFPLPIFTCRIDFALPRNPEEFTVYQAGPHRDDVAAYHDFRFWEDRDWLYVIYHEGAVTKVWDAVVRIKTRDFLSRVDESVSLLDGNPSVVALHAEWERLWWREEVWLPCGVDGTNRIYPSDMNKNDIVFLRLSDESLMMYHRPVPDIAAAKTGGVPFLEASEDGITKVGVLQSCIRPGYRDNSHIGNNGIPIRVDIDGIPAAMDVVHGVYNEAISNPAIEKKWKLTYYPYLRLLDVETGGCLYYSRDPILEYDGVWDEYARHGEWIANLSHLDGVMFAGGQVEVERGKNGLDDVFRFYTGVGDTAVAVADFRLRDLLPEQAITDIRALKRHRLYESAERSENRKVLEPEASGWRWSIANGKRSRTLSIRRELRGEISDRVVVPRPGFFDADCLSFDGESVIFLEELGWLILYCGTRWTDSPKRSVFGTGVLLLDRENPERVLYRSEEPLPAGRGGADGWVCGVAEPVAPLTPDLIPNRVRNEVKAIYERKPMPSDMTRWLLRKAEAIDL